ncbi:MAG TPA: hypothetical protein VGG49_04380 [Steroidobacteraceae bacterium]|jgi:hypothetical protein
MANSTLRTTAREHPGPGALVIFAGPLAWFAQLNIGYALATQPCFPADHRLLLPDARWAWAYGALYAVDVLCMLIALWGFAQSMGALRRQRGTPDSVTAMGSRARFAALWGAAFGGGFFVATLLTGVGLVLLPRCGG